MGSEIVKKYTNGEITVRWQPAKCIHATTCFKMLPEVFKPRERPWVKINAASTDEIIKTVEACPTDALTWLYNDPNRNNNNNFTKMQENSKQKPKIEIIDNGPLFIPASVDLVNHDGKILKVNEDKYVCRCGHSKNKPFCDGSHMKTGSQ